MEAAWFAIVSAMLAVYAVLDGFDFGVGAIHRIVARTDEERRTVLAAIGQIESADGTNEGPSTAGAMGPMQFLPSTWALWGIDGFGETGPPNILDPYDAVPAAARLLCADGAAAGGSSLYHAIFDYNHADWYVNEVLGLAAEYAADYR